MAQIEKEIKKQILDDVESYLDGMKTEDREAPLVINGVAVDKCIVIPSKDIEALLIANATGNRTATTDICNRIRAIAEKQGYRKF